MTEPAYPENLAEAAGDRTLIEVHRCLEQGDSFIVEAGAGAGKTYTLVKALEFLIKRHRYSMPQRHQQVACITFTNVAKDEIEARTDRSPLISCHTIHAFCWSLIKGFQREMLRVLPTLKSWTDLLVDFGDVDNCQIQYELGRRRITETDIAIHHDDVISLTIALMEKTKFRRILVERYPIILIDEYQDTDADWIESIKKHFLGHEDSPLFGFFGDHWQKIYGNGCGKIEHPCLKIIGKEANFRSVATVVECLNRMRPALPQSVVDPDADGEVRVFHTNEWQGPRRGGGHWNGDLHADDAERALESILDCLAKQGWDLSPESTKILMLTHRVLAARQGYPSIPEIFRFNESFTNRENQYVAFFADVLEPACNAYVSGKYGEMFRAFGGTTPTILSHSDKREWSTAMDKLLVLRDNSTVGEVLNHILTVRRAWVPEFVARNEAEIRTLVYIDSEEDSNEIEELKNLRKVSYQEIVALCCYLSGHSPFETKHGVKGAEFDNVIVVVGRGWNQYNFNQMLEQSASSSTIPSNRPDAFERNRNLFYVSCSRARIRLAILFTQQLSNEAFKTIQHWFGSDTIEPLDL